MAVMGLADIHDHLRERRGGQPFWRLAPEDAGGNLSKTRFRIRAFAGDHQNTAPPHSLTVCDEDFQGCVGASGAHPV